MTWYIYLISCLSLATHVTVAAQNTFAFKAKVIHNKAGLLKQFSLLVNSNLATTNDAGIFVIPLQNSITHVKIQPQQGRYVVLYPTAGYVAIPRDLNDLPEIIIGSPTDNTFLKQYLNLYKAIKNTKSTTSSEVKALDAKLDSLQKIMLQLHYTDTDLRKAKDMQDGRDNYYAEISENLAEFVSRAVDLKASFQYVANFAFENPAALQNLHGAVVTYTNIYNILNRQRSNYLKQVDEYWQDDSLTTKYNTLITYALDSLHANRLFPLQAQITQINEYFSGTKSTGLKEKILQHIKEQEVTIQPMLDELKKFNNQFQKDLTR